MDKNYYRILKELNSLKQAIPSLEKIIAGELSRIDKIEKLREIQKSNLLNWENRLMTMTQELQEVENNISKMSASLTKAQTDCKGLISEHEINSLDKQMKLLTEKIDEAEMNGLSIIEQCQELEQNIKDAKSFLKGSLETIHEIEAEINSANADIYNEINIKKMRIKNLFEELPTNVVNKLHYLENKGPRFIPLSQLTEQNTCQMCGYLTPMAIVSSIEKYQRFHTCSACERILIP